MAFAKLVALIHLKRRASGAIQQRGGARLADLLQAFNQLKVPAEDRIAILRTLNRSGKLHAQLIEE